MNKISVKEDFSVFPTGREIAHSDSSGEEFRLKFLVPALRQPGRVPIDFERVLGAGSSFLEEAFGRLVFNEKLTFSKFEEKFQLLPTDSSYVEEIYQYVRDAEKEWKRLEKGHGL